MMMSQLSMDLSIEEPLTSYQQDSPANRTPLLDFVKRLVMSVTYGEKSSEYYGRRNQHGSWVKTSQDSLLLSEDNSLDVSSMTWSRWGIALDGVAMELRMSGQFTKEIGSSLLPTPQTFDSIPPDKRIKNSKIIVQENGRTVKVNPNGVKWTADLLTTVQARQMLPTPRANNAMATNLTSENLRNHLHPNLEVVIARQADVGTQLGVEIGESGESERLYLNPEFVETMMGFPIGWTSIEPND